MGLLNIVRSGVKVADKLTKDLQAEITFERYISSDGAGDKTYAASATIKAIVEDKQEIVRSLSGELSQSKTHITILDTAKLLTITANQGVKEQDRITLPNGESGRILALGGFIDAGTEIPVATEVYLG